MSREEQEIFFKKLEVSLELFNKHLEEMQGNAAYREQHRTEHEFLRAKIREAEAAAARNERVVSGILTMSVWSLIVAMVGAIGFTIKSWITGGNPLS